MNDVESLVENNIKLAHYVCRKFSGEYDDLFQTGCIGLIKAAKTFNPDRGNTFASYAVPIIRNEILMSFRRKRVATISLDEPIGQDNKGDIMTLSDVLASDEDIEADVISVSEMREKTRLLKSILSPKYLTVLNLYLSGKKQIEISNATGFSRKYVNKLIVEMRKRGAIIDKDYQAGSNTRMRRLSRA